jgi:hypothetical protein
MRAQEQAQPQAQPHKRATMGKFVKGRSLRASTEQLNHFGYDDNDNDNDDNDDSKSNNNNSNDRGEDDNVSNDDESLLSSDDDCSTTVTSLHGSRNKAGTAVEYENKTEEYAVLGMKWTVYFVLFIAAAAVGFVTFILTEKDEKSTFEGEVSTIKVANTVVMYRISDACRKVANLPNLHSFACLPAT